MFSVLLWCVPVLSLSCGLWWVFLWPYVVVFWSPPACVDLCVGFLNAEVSVFFHFDCTVQEGQAVTIIFCLRIVPFKRLPQRITALILNYSLSSTLTPTTSMSFFPHPQVCSLAYLFASYLVAPSQAFSYQCLHCPSSEHVIRKYTIKLDPEKQIFGWKWLPENWEYSYYPLVFYIHHQ